MMLTNSYSRKKEDWRILSSQDCKYDCYKLLFKEDLHFETIKLKLKLNINLI